MPYLMPHDKPIALAAIELSISKPNVKDGTFERSSCDNSETTLTNRQPFEFQTCKASPQIKKKPLQLQSVQLPSLAPEPSPITISTNPEVIPNEKKV